MIAYRYLISLAALLVLPNMAGAANHYIRAGAAGANSGSDWVNAWTSVPSTLVRGDVYYVADGNYPGFSFGTAASGSAYVTIKKATQADHGTESGWSSAYGDGVATFGVINVNSSYLTFDGSVGSGKSGHGFEVTNDAGGFGLINFRNGTVTNINIKHAHIHYPTSEASYTADGIYGLRSCDNCSISYSYIHDTPRVPVYPINWSNFLFEHNYVARNRSTPAAHAEGLAIRGGKNHVYRYNTFEDIEGTAIIVNLTNPLYGLEVYGNLFFKSGNPTYGNPSHGIVSDNFSSDTYNSDVIGFRYYNNTAVGFRGNNAGLRFWSAGSKDLIAYNNLWYDCVDIGMVKVSHDKNYYSSSTFTYEYSKEPNEQVTTVNPFVNSTARDYRLAKPTNPGVTLGSPYNADVYGNARGSDGNWDRGAFEYGGTVTIKTPNPPTGLTAD